MADSLAVLFQLKAQNQASPVVKTVQQDVAKLSQSTTQQFNAMQQISTAALGKITSSLSNFSSQLPVVGGAVQGLSTEIGTMAESTAVAGSEFAAIAGPIGIAVAGFGALTLGVVELGKAIFNNAEAAAKFRGEFADLSQQIGVSTETLSGLEVLASNTGGSIQTIVASLGIFQKTLEASHDPTSKEAALLKQLGVNSLDTETALRQALKGLNDMGEGAAQTTAVLELFGRGGRFVNAILKESHGNLDEALKGFRDLGLEVGGPAAAAADQFNDSYNLLSRQLTAITHQIVGDTIPIFTLLFQDISRGLTGNQDDWRTWRGFIEFETAAAIAAVQSFAQFVASRGTLSLDSLFEGNLQGLLGRADRLRNETQFNSDLERVRRLTAGILAGRPGDGTGTAKASGGKSEAEKQLERETKLWESLAAELGRVTDELLGVNTASREYAITQEVYSGVLEKAKVSEQERALAAAKNIDEITKQNRLTKEYTNFVKALDEQVRQALVGQKSQLQITNEFIDALFKQGKFLSATEEFWLRFNSLIVDTNKNLDGLAEKIQRAAEATQGPSFEGVERKGGGLEGVGEAPPVPELFDPGKDVFSDIQHAMEQTLGLSHDLAAGITDVLAASFSSLGQAVGQAVESFVLFGKVEGGFKRFAAEMIAQIAAMAAVQAVYQLAQALAWTALNFFFPNPAYVKAASAAFASAAVFGSIAGVAAGAGRLVAGNSFNQSPGGGDNGGGGGGGGSARRGSPSQGQTVDIDRRRVGGRTEEVIHFRVRGVDVVNEFIRDYNLNGPTRIIITGDKS